MKKAISVAILLFLVPFNSFAGDKVGELLSRLSHAQKESVRVHIIAFDLWHINDPRIDKLFSKKLSQKRTEEAYYIAQYLAERGNRKALGILNKNNFKYPISSWQWSYTLRLFGKYKFAPAIPTLIEDLDAASLNVVDEAYKALLVFYPNSPKTFASPRDAKEYFEKRYAESQQGAPADRPTAAQSGGG